MTTIQESTVTPAIVSIPAPKVGNKNKEGQGGKGNIMPSASKAQLSKQFSEDSNALASILVALGAIERTQSGKNGVICRRVYADLSVLLANRAKLSSGDKKLAGAALDAAEKVGALRGKFISLELFRESIAVRSRKSAGKFHKRS